MKVHILCCHRGVLGGKRKVRKKEKEKKKKRKSAATWSQVCSLAHTKALYSGERERESKHGGPGIFMASANSKTPGDCFENAHSPASIKQPDAHNFCCQPSSLIYIFSFDLFSSSFFFFFFFFYSVWPPTRWTLGMRAFKSLRWYSLVVPGDSLVSQHEPTRTLCDMHLSSTHNTHSNNAIRPGVVCNFQGSHNFLLLLPSFWFGLEKEITYLSFTWALKFLVRQLALTTTH